MMEMWRRRHACGLITLLLLIVLFFSQFGNVFAATVSKNESVKVEDAPVTHTPISSASFSMEKARQFLESQYVQEAGLLRAAVTAEPDRRRVYVASDNLLAARALILLRSGLGKSILEKLAVNYEYGFNARHEVILGFDIPDEFYVLRDEKLAEVYSKEFDTTFELRYEKPDTSRVLTDWYEYADLLVYRALDRILAERVNEARELSSLLLSLWDGYGFNDRTHMADDLKRYETYKVALALLLCKVLTELGQDCGARRELLDKWQSVLASMQRDDGGVVTHYIAKRETIEPYGDANTETTSIVTLALSGLPSIFRPESKLYLMQVEVTTDSDWTFVNILSGPRVIDYDGTILVGSDVPELKYSFSGSHIWIAKKQYDTKTVTLRLVGMAVKGSELGRIVISKGHIGSTEVIISLWDGKQFTRFISLKHEGVNWTEPAANSRFFTVSYANLYAKPSAAAFYEPASPVLRRKVCAFYYPWYGNPFGPSGSLFHWSSISAESIASSTHYPLLGPYDSYDERVVEAHMLMARAAGIDCFIVSWWGPETFEDSALRRILNVGGRVGFNITIYYESYREWRPLTRPRDVINELAYVVKEYANFSSFLKANGKPVLFIYSVSAHQRGMDFWLTVRQNLEGLVGHVYLIGDLRDQRYLNVFDGFHTYIELNLTIMKDVFDFYKQQMSLGLAGMDLNQAMSLIMLKGNPTIQEKILGFTVIPGYDDRKIRHPGSYVDRRGEDTYKSYWNSALEANPDIILITSWNEWHEGTEIEPSREYGFSYIRLTAEYATKFKGGTAPSIEEPSLQAEYLLSSDGRTLILKLTTNRTALIITPEISFQSSLRPTHVENYLTFTTKRNGFDIISRIFPLLKPGETLELRLKLTGLIPETILIHSGHVTYYSIDGSKFVLETVQERFHRLVITTMENTSIIVQGVTYSVKGGNVSLWLREKTNVSISMKAIWYLNDSIRKMLASYIINNREFMIFEPREDFAITIDMDRPIEVVTRWKTQYLLRVADPLNLLSREEWVDENEIMIKEAPQEVSVEEGVRIVFKRWEGSLKSDERRIQFSMDGPKVLSVVWRRQFYLAVEGVDDVSGWYDEGASVTVSVQQFKQQDGGRRYRFDGWYGDVSSNTPTIAITMDGPKRVATRWVEQFYVEVLPGFEKARVYGGGWHDSGSTITITAERDVGSGVFGVKYLFDGWLIDGKIISGDAEMRLLVDSPKTVFAKYRPEYTILLSTIVLTVAGGVSGALIYLARVRKRRGC